MAGVLDTFNLDGFNLCQELVEKYSWEPDAKLVDVMGNAERAVDIIVSTLSADRRLGPGRVAAIKRRAFHAILDDEESRLGAIPGLFATLRREIG